MLTRRLCQVAHTHFRPLHLFIQSATPKNQHRQHYIYSRRMTKRRNSQLELPVLDPTKTIDTSDKNYKPIVWVDCEPLKMTGLDVFNDFIIEVCCIVTDGDLNIVHEGYESVVHKSKEVMDAMNPWCVNQHGKSGLTQKVLDSTKTIQQVETELLAYVEKYTKKGTAVLAGNSIHMDRAFMMREMPKVLGHLHYRIIDVSSFFELGRRHNYELVSKCPKKRNSHTARDDILESIAQLKWFRENYLVGPPPSQPVKQQKLEQRNEDGATDQAKTTE